MPQNSILSFIIVKGMRTKMWRRKPFCLTITGVGIDHQFWQAHLENLCTISLYLLSTWGCMCSGLCFTWVWQLCFFFHSASDERMRRASTPPFPALPAEGPSTPLQPMLTAPAIAETQQSIKELYERNCEGLGQSQRYQMQRLLEVCWHLHYEGWGLYSY